MKLFVLLILSLLSLSYIKSAETKSTRDVRRFPDHFTFGAATAAYQIEGAWDEDGKSESIWDHLTHTQPEIIADKQNGDIAADSYHQYKRDVEMIRELGVDYYRFSVAWTRILPSGFPNQVNELGVKYYNNLINELLMYNIQPMITLYHNDLPQRLKDLGGWDNPLIVDWFGDYARVVYELFGDRVKNFITINEPRDTCVFHTGIDGISVYLCAKNIVLAHAKAWHIYDEEFRALQSGITGITLSMSWYLPISDSEDDVQATYDVRQFEWAWGYPIFSETGDWHPTFKSRIASRSAEQGFPRSRLPQFTQEEIDYVKGASDFLGINMYTSYLVYRNATVLENYPELSYFNDAYADANTNDPSWPTSAASWLQETPWGLHLLLLKVKEEYNNPIVYITENGFPSRGGLDDDDRVQYYRNYLSAVLDALDDGCDVRGYLAWSLMDNFEWAQGYTEKFGLYEVDFEDPARTRTPRKSAFVYKEIVKSRVIDYSYQPSATIMTVDEGH